MQSTMEKMTGAVNAEQGSYEGSGGYPGKPNTIHLREVPKPCVEDVPEGRGVADQDSECRVDGTDKEINAAEYGAAPSRVTILDHRARKLRTRRIVGPNVTEFRPAITFSYRAASGFESLRPNRAHTI